MVELAAERLPRHYGVDPVRDIQVLAPIYRGLAGVDVLNARLRELLNANGDACMDGAVRVGDKLIQTRNDYDTGLMNGQIVIACGENDEGEELRPAYAISIHKSQGCEMPIVVVPVHTSHAVLLSRNLLYTAVTRAKMACVLVGQPEALRRAVSRAGAFRRHTRLGGLLAERVG